MPRGKKPAATKALIFDPVDEYPEKTDDIRSDEESIRAERRTYQDQIVDYHEVNPTLDTSGPEHDPDEVEKLRREAIGAVEASVPIEYVEEEEE